MRGIALPAQKHGIYGILLDMRALSFETVLLREISSVIALRSSNQQDNARTNHSVAGYGQICKQTTGEALRGRVVWTLWYSMSRGGEGEGNADTGGLPSTSVRWPGVPAAFGAMSPRLDCSAGRAAGSFDAAAATAALTVVARMATGRRNGMAAGKGGGDVAAAGKVEGGWGEGGGESASHSRAGCGGGGRVVVGGGSEGSGKRELWTKSWRRPITENAHRVNQQVPLTLQQTGHVPLEVLQGKGSGKNHERFDNKWYFEQY